MVIEIYTAWGRVLYDDIRPSQNYYITFIRNLGSLFLYIYLPMLSLNLLTYFYNAEE